MVTESGSKFRSDGADAGSKTVYILLPYYQRGNLQDAINANLVNHTSFPERDLMILMLGVARALKCMHQYKVKDSASRGNGNGAAKGKSKSKPTRRTSRRVDDDEDESEHEPLMEGEVAISQEGVEEGEYRPYSHRDIKPGIYSSLKLSSYDERRLIHM